MVRLSIQAAHEQVNPRDLLNDVVTMASDILIVWSWMNLRIGCFHSTGNKPCRQVGVERRILLNDSISRDNKKTWKGDNQPR
jgi:hypothetical protein